jgi:translocator protein
MSLIIWIVLCFSAAAFGAMFPPDAWYAGLQKPSWNPPNWLFGPVWTALYLAMAVAANMIWRSAPHDGRWRLAISLMIVQLLANAAWSAIFFGAKRMDIALVEICVLWLLILTTMIVFWRIKPLAGILFAPYLVWVSFAGFLNFTLWRLNH